MSESLHNAVKNSVTRGKVAGTAIGARTFLQVTGLDGVVQQVIELLLPPGYSANPVAGSDVALLQVLGSGDHVVALGGDLAGNAIADLAPGEFGLSDGINRIVVRNTYLELTSPTYVQVNSPMLKCTGDILDNCNAQTKTMANMRTIYDSHAHPGVATGTGTSGTPNATM